jgi:hypothetical protein
MVPFILFSLAEWRVRPHEEQFMEQREYWRVVLASIGDAVILTDTAGLVTCSNLGGTLFRDIPLFFP